MPTDNKFYIPPEGPPQGIKPHPDIFKHLGEEKIFTLLSDFYKALEKSSIRALFPEDMQAASKRSAAFFVFILGGPPLYHQKYGSPMMRQRHLPFKIDEAARQVWLDCFRQVLDKADEKYGFPIEHIESFWTFLERFSAWMVNSR
jgi:hemoglobin